MLDILKIVLYFVVFGISIYIESLTGSDWLLATVLIWIGIGIYCYIRFGIFRDEP